MIALWRTCQTCGNRWDPEADTSPGEGAGLCQECWEAGPDDE